MTRPRALSTLSYCGPTLSTGIELTCLDRPSDPLYMHTDVEEFAYAAVRRWKIEYFTPAGVELRQLRATGGSP